MARREFSGEEIKMELLPEAVDGERTRFTGVLTAPSEPELLWYHFTDPFKVRRFSGCH